MTQTLPLTAQGVAVTAPNGGEVWAPGSVQDITWNTTNVVLARIEYRARRGEAWQLVAEVEGPVGRYAWTVPYDATAVRPDWADLPAGLRDAVAARLGGPPAAVRLAGAGFTRGFAAVLTGPDGGRVFVKAAALDGQRHLVDWYAHEAAILARLPAGLPVPRPRWALTEAGWYALGLDAVPGHTPRLPWDPAELDVALPAAAGRASTAAQIVLGFRGSGGNPGGARGWRSAGIVFPLGAPKRV